MHLTNIPATFLQTMNNLFMDMLDKGVVFFLDNILIYSNLADENLGLMKKILTHLYNHTFYCKLKKCGFLQKSTIFLRFDITPEGMNISDTKMRTLKE